MIDAPLVRALVAAQFPRWAGLALAPVVPGGHDHRTFRLGNELAVRLPGAAGYAGQVVKERRWLPRLAPHLPLAVPEPVALGEPGEGFPWRWAVVRWIPGEDASVAPCDDRVALARDLAGFLRALWALDATGGPAPGPHNFLRGAPPAVYDGETRAALARLDGSVDVAGARAVWEAALDAPSAGAPVWVHGDVAASNLLLREGRLAAVLDFGGLGVGDPACDLTVAWTAFRGEAREAFRAALALDDGAWARARGWAAWKALITLAALCDGGPDDARAARRTLADVVAEQRGG